MTFQRGGDEKFEKYIPLLTTYGCILYIVSSHLISPPPHVLDHFLKLFFYSVVRRFPSPQLDFLPPGFDIPLHPCGWDYGTIYTRGGRFTYFFICDKEVGLAKFGTPILNPLMVLDFFFMLVLFSRGNFCKKNGQHA